MTSGSGSSAARISSATTQAKLVRGDHRKLARPRHAGLPLRPLSPGRRHVLPDRRSRVGPLSLERREGRPPRPASASHGEQKPARPVSVGGDTGPTSGPQGILSAPGAADDDSHPSTDGLCRPGPARDLASDAACAAAAAPRGRPRLAAGSRRHDAAEARQARARHRSRRPRAPAAPLRDGRGRGRDRRAPPGRGVRGQRPRAQRREAADARAAADADRRAGRRRHGCDQRHLVQPAVARRPARAGNGGPAARQARPLRLRAAFLRHRRRSARHGRLRSGLPGGGGDRGRDGAAGRRRGAPARGPRPRSAPGRAARARGAGAEARRARRGAPAARPRGGRDRAAATRLRGAARPAGRDRAARGRARADARAGARRAGRPDPPLPQGAAVRAHAVPGAGDPGDRRRPRAHRPDAAAPAGRRRLGQDGGRPLRAPARGRERSTGRAHGSDGNPR